MKHILLAIALLLVPISAHAQSVGTYQEDSGATKNNIGVYIKGGAVGGGAITAADCAISAMGCQADAKSTVTDTTPATQIALLKGQIDRLAAINTALGSLAITNTTFAATQSGTWTINSITGTVTITDGSGIANSLTVDNATASNFNAQVVGAVASGATDSGNPVKTGCYAMNTAPTAVTNGQRANAWCFLNGQQAATLVDSAGGTIANNLSSTDGQALQPPRTINVASYPYVFNGTLWDRKRGDVNGTNTQLAMTSSRWQYAAASGGISNTTTAVTVCPAQGGTLRCYMSNLQIDTSALGAATELVVRDGAGGTVIWRGLVGTAGVPAENITFSTPLKGTANTLMEIATVTASITGSVYPNAQGFSGN